MITSTPKFSIITINLNNKEGLVKTIESVVNQTFQNFEYIVIDGASNDGSVNIIKQYQNRMHFWTSEKDSGIYNAMNKGIKHANGEYLLFLNSGDRLFKSDVLENVSPLIEPNIAVCTGNIYVDDSKSLTEYPSPQNLNCSYFIKGNLFHQASFIHKKMFEKYGLYNESNRIVSDWEFFILTLILKGENYQKLSTTISVYNPFGISNNPSAEEMHKKERKQVLDRLIPLAIQSELSSLQASIEQEQILNRRFNERRYKMMGQIEKSKPIRHFATGLLFIMSKLANIAVRS